MLTHHRCLPAANLASLSPPDSPTHVEVFPPDAFDRCTNTTGSTEVINVKKSNAEDENWVSLDIIGAYGLATVAFSIDEHDLWIYAVDGDYIEPQKVGAVVVTNGDRYSIFVRLNKPGDYAIRTASLAAVQLVEGHATLSYRDGKTPPLGRPSVPHLNPAGKAITDDVVFFDQAAMKAFPAHAPSLKADETFRLDMQIGRFTYLWSLNKTEYSSALDNATPLLFDPKPYIQNNVTLTTKNGSWVDLIIEGKSPMPPHPIHKHGNKMYLIGSGTGVFNYTSVEEAIRTIPGNFNLIDPPVRDGFATPEASTHDVWMVVRYHVTNPGPWLLHCHIQSHLVGGMSVAIQDGIDAWPIVPPEYLTMA